MQSQLVLHKSALFVALPFLFAIFVTHSVNVTPVVSSRSPFGHRSSRSWPYEIVFITPFVSRCSENAAADCSHLIGTCRIRIMSHYGQQ